MLKCLRIPGNVQDFRVQAGKGKTKTWVHRCRKGVMTSSPCPLPVGMRDLGEPGVIYREIMAPDKGIREVVKRGVMREREGWGERVEEG